MSLFKEALCLIIRRLPFTFNTDFMFFMVSTLKPSKGGECFQSNKWLVTALPSGVTCFLVNGEIQICFPMVSYTFTTIGFITESTMKIIKDTRCNYFGMRYLKRKAFANLHWLLNSISHSLLESHHELRKKESLRVVLLAIVCYFVTIRHLLKALVC